MYNPNKVQVNEYAYNRLLEADEEDFVWVVEFCPIKSATGLSVSTELLPAFPNLVLDLRWTVFGLSVLLTIDSIEKYNINNSGEWWMLGYITEDDPAVLPGNTCPRLSGDIG